MDNQASNVNFFDDLEKWLDLSNYARPLGKSPTVDGDFGSKEKPRDAWQPKPETESTFTIDGKGVNVETTEIPGQFPPSQSGAGSGNVNNQLGAAFQHNIKSYQEIRGVTSYTPLSVGLGGARADFEARSNTSGSGANTPTDSYATDSTSDGVQPMRWTQPSTNSASVHHPEKRKHTNSAFGVVTLAGIGRPATGANGINGGAMMVPLSSLNDPFTAYPAADGIRAVPGPSYADGIGFTSGDPQRAISKDGSEMEKEATARVDDGSPQHVASGSLANESNHALSTATGKRRGPLLPVDPQDDLTRLKDGLVKNGAEVDAVNLCDEIFKDGIHKETLQKRLTREQCEKLHLRDGKQFQRLLEKVEVVGETKNRCRLCPGNVAVLYKNHRDALRHFHKEHFGLCYECTRCDHKAFTKPELTRHVKIAHGVISDE